LVLLTEHESVSSLKVGLLIVTLAYFLFNAHTLFTLQWVGEWNPLSEPLKTAIMLEDVSAFVGVIFRFIAGIIAFGAVVFYFSKEPPSTEKTYRVLRWILVFEAIYWLSLIPTAGVEVYFDAARITQTSIIGLLNNLALTTIPALVESMFLPATLLMLVFKLNPSRPQNKMLKWGLITGTVYLVVFWLLNTSMWVGVVRTKGLEYLWAVPLGANQTALHPEHLVSFIITAFGLLALAIYSGYLSWKFTKEGKLKIRVIGEVILALGTYFLWNYFSWALFASNVWNDWYAWFLGHNMDLWALSLPLVGVPLLFYVKQPKQTAQATDKDAG
jgi:hypothetical protein